MDKIRLLLLAFFAITMMASCSSNTSKNESDEETAEAVEESSSSSEEGITAVVGKEYALDASASTVKWEGKKPTGTHNGTINVKSGNVRINDGAVVGGMVSIDMTSIAVTDLTEETGAGKLKGHLTSDDFFGVANHPVSVFKINSVSEGGSGDATHTLTGELTIKGKTAEIMVPAMISMADGKATIKGDAIVDRTVFDVRHGSKKFFDNLGDKWINDEFTIGFNISANL